MQVAQAELRDFFIVQLCAVAFVLREAVLRIFLIHFAHIAVTGHFGKDRRGGNGHAFGIALDDRDFVAGESGLTVAVDQSKIRLHAQRFHGAAHGEKGGLQNVDLVDLFFACRADAVGDGFFTDNIIKRLTLFFAEFFGIVEPFDLAVFRQDHRRRANRSAQRAAACFVNAANMNVAFCSKLVLIGKIHNELQEDKMRC